MSYQTNPAKNPGPKTGLNFDKLFELMAKKWEFRQRACKQMDAHLSGEKVATISSTTNPKQTEETKG